MLDTITLDGRKFAGITQSLTANQDTYIMGKLRRAGAIEVLQDLDGVKRSTKKRADDLLTQIKDSPYYFHVLAGVLTEEGKVWSREEAEANAERFEAITDLPEKSALQTQMVKFVLDFFWYGAQSSETSLKSANRNGRVPRTKSAAPPISETSQP